MLSNFHRKPQRAIYSLVVLGILLGVAYQGFLMVTLLGGGDGSIEWRRSELSYKHEILEKILQQMPLREDQKTQKADSSRPARTTRPNIITHKDQPSIVLATFVFGEEAANKRYLQIFTKTAELSGVDVIVFGSPAPPFALPPNVRHISCTWDDFVESVSQRLFDGHEPGTLRQASYYKIVDFKPLFAYLFPEHVHNYEWWGHVDNDMVLGNVRNFMTTDVLSNHDIISPKSNRNVFGPFTLYRNTQKVNEIFQLARLPLSTIFGTTFTTNFDEWGKMNSHQELKLSHNSTMDGILDEHAIRLGIRIHQFSGIISWDGVCSDNERRCEECIYDKNILTTTREKQRLLCHYRIGKQYLEASLENQNTLDQILRDEQFRVSYPEGFSPVGKHRAANVNPESIEDASLDQDDDHDDDGNNWDAEESTDEDETKDDATIDINFYQLSKMDLSSILPPLQAAEAPCFQLAKNQLVTVGGFYGDYSNVTRKIQLFDIKEESWSDFDLPDGVAETHQGVAFDKSTRWLYIVSGQLGGGFLPATSAAIRIHVDTKFVEYLPPLPAPRYSPSAVIVSDNIKSHLHVFGGLSEDRVSPSLEHWRIDISAKLSADSKWEELEMTPFAGAHGWAVYNDDDGFIYYGGFCSNDFPMLRDTTNRSSRHKNNVLILHAHHVPRNGLSFRYATSNAAKILLDPSTIGHWERIEDMALPTCQSGIITMHNRLFLFGGAQTTPIEKVSPIPHSFVQAFNFETLKWEVLSILPDAIRHGCVFVDEKERLNLFRTGEWHLPGSGYPKSPFFQGTISFNEEVSPVSKRLVATKAGSRRIHAEQFFECLGDLSSLCQQFWSGAYESVRASWNKLYDSQQRPNAVCFPKATEEISSIIRCAKRTGHSVCGRNGKHSFSGDSCSYGIVVDVTEFNTIERIDRDGSLKNGWKLGAGNHLGQAAVGLYRNGYILPIGHCPSVGLTGFTLVGGQGYLSRLYGMSSDHVSAVEYVDFAGRPIVATEDNEFSDALWLARGGGGYVPFPGIITSWQYKSLPLAETRNETENVWTEIEVYWNPTLSNAEAIFGGWQDLFLNDDFVKDPLAHRLTVEFWIAFYPSKSTGSMEKILKLTAVFYGTDDMHGEAEERLFPLLETIAGPKYPPKKSKMKRFGFLDFLRRAGGVKTNAELLSGHHGWGLVDLPPNGSNRWKGHSAASLDKVPGEAIGPIVHAMWEAEPLRKRYTEFKSLRGAIQSNMDKSATGFWHRDALFWSLSSHFWQESDSQATVEAVLSNSYTAHEQFTQNLGSHYCGSYAGYVDRTNSSFHDMQRYYGGNAERISRVRHKLDPHNVFAYFLPNREADLP